MNNPRTASDERASSTITELETVDKILEASGLSKLGNEPKPQRMWVQVPAAEGKDTVAALASDLEVPFARIIQIVRQRLPNHRNLPALSPNSTLGPRLAKVIRQTVAQAPPVRFPLDPQDIHWIG